MHFRVFSKGQGTEWGYFLGSLKFQIFFGMLEIPDIFRWRMVDAWPEPTYAEKMKKVNKQCLLDTTRTVRVSEKTWQVIVQTSRP